jgi:23S rRNA (uracil1939-C5)-methyltransferase
MARGHVPPFETEIEHLGDRGVGVGRSPDGRAVHVRGAPPGARVAVQVFHRSKGVLQARRTTLIRPAAGHAEPRCAVFGLCGGCVLQELRLDAQRRAKVAWAVEAAGAGPEVVVHPVRGTAGAYGTRNKVELSFGVRRWLDEAERAADLPIEGRFLGFHAPGRFDRVVDTERCELISERANAVLATLRRVTLHDGAAPPWDVRTHQGTWRHAVLREGFATGELLVALTTSPAADEAEVATVAEALLATPLEGGEVVGVVWQVNAGVADVARGEVQRVWGRDTITEVLGDVPFRLSPSSFFQTSTEGAVALYDAVGEALGEGGTLVDLYCGTGAIGLYLASRHARIVGIEEVAPAVEDARANAAALGVEATYVVGKVEDALTTLDAVPGPRRLVVDPPRAGLHPKVARALAAAHADVLVYVACHPPSLGRDAALLAEGGWRLTDLWPVDLFPQTGHLELVGRFVRSGA